jgi:hypothetical protein
VTKRVAAATPDGRRKSRSIVAALSALACSSSVCDIGPPDDDERLRLVVLDDGGHVIEIRRFDALRRGRVASRAARS